MPQKTDTGNGTKDKSFHPNFSTPDNNPDPYKLINNESLDTWDSNIHKSDKTRGEYGEKVTSSKNMFSLATVKTIMSTLESRFRSQR